MFVREVQTQCGLSTHKRQCSERGLLRPSKLQHFCEVWRVFRLRRSGHEPELHAALRAARVYFGPVIPWEGEQESRCAKSTPGFLFYGPIGPLWRVSGGCAIVPCMVVRMRHTRAHTANRRSHHALKDRALATCECGAPRVSHRACPSCGRYNGRVAVDLVAKKAARLEKRSKGKAAVGNKSEVQK